MKRVVPTIAVFLLAGLVVSVAVAWGCAVTIDVDSPARSEQRTITVTAPREIWIVATQSRAGAKIVISRRHRYDTEVKAVSGFSVPPEDLVPSWSQLQRPPHRFEDRSCHGVSQVVDSRGWPLRMLWSEPVTTYWCDTTTHQSNPVAGGIATSLREWNSLYGDVFPRTLPLRPIWSGISVNTVLYAAILWVLSGGPFFLRRRLRLRRGLCPSCAYPMGASPTCTECGKTLAQGAVA